MERTLAIIKPDGVKRGLIGEVLRTIEQHQIQIAALRLMQLDRDLAHKFYQVHQGKDFFAPLLDFMTSGPVVVMVLQGADVIQRWRRLAGATNPQEAAAGTIRRRFGTNVQQNIVHGSDSADNAAFEIGCFFKPEEILAPAAASEPAAAAPSDPQTYIALEDQYGAHNYHPLDIVVQKGDGIWLYDVTGKRYLDFLSAYSAVNQGHCHPRLVRALTEQAQRLTLTSRAFRNDRLGAFYQRLQAMTGYEKILPMNTGAEAVETALKAARKWGYQVRGIAPDQGEIITCQNNFHGRTITIISFSTEDQYRQGFGPFTPGFRHIPFGDAAALEQAIGPNTVAFLVEPIQGEGGVIVPPRGYLQQVARICREHRVLLITDEIQTGLGRTGRLLAADHEEVRADILILGKALSGGLYPVSAILANQEIMDVFQPGDHGSTYGGNPLGVAVACEALAVLEEEGMIANAAELGTYFQQRLATIESPYIKEIRGVGLLIGVELHPQAQGARRFCEALMQKGLLCKETHEHVIRFAPPLMITKEELDWAFERIVQVFQEI